MRSLAFLRFVAVVPFMLVVAQACGDSSSGGSGGPGAGGDSGGEGPSSGGNTNPGQGGEPGTGEGGSGAQVGAGGEGGQTNPPRPVALESRPGSAIVVDGVVATSQNFKVILTLGEGPSGNTTMKSTRHRVNLGLIGSTQP